MLLTFEWVLTFVLICGLKTIDAGDCPDNWTVYGPSCYLFGHQALPFYTAEQYCRQHNAYLVHIKSPEENVFIREHLRYMKGVQWWIGLTDDDVEDTWRWYGTNELAEYTDWTPGQPTNWGNNEDCVEFDMTAGYDGHWNDAPCDKSLLPICESSTGTLKTTTLGKLTRNRARNLTRSHFVYAGGMEGHSKYDDQLPRFIKMKKKFGEKRDHVVNCRR